MGEFEVPQSRSYESRPVTYSEMARYAGAQDASAMVGVEVPPAAVEAVLSHRWGASNLPPDAHAEHNYYGGCAVCRGDVPAVLAVAAPHIAAAALRLAAEELWDRMDGDRLAAIYHAWLCHRADELDGRQPSPDTREGILDAAGLTEADMAERRVHAETLQRLPGLKCGMRYVRPGGEDRGDRIVRCTKNAGHDGDGWHEEIETGSRWPVRWDACVRCGDPIPPDWTRMWGPDGSAHADCEHYRSCVTDGFIVPPEATALTDPDEAVR